MFLKKDKKNDNKGYKRILIYIIVFLVTYVILLTTISPKKHNLSVGDIATVDIKAPIDTVDEIATQEKIEEAIAKAKEDKKSPKTGDNTQVAGYAVTLVACIALIAYYFKKMVVSK